MSEDDRRPDIIVYMSKPPSLNKLWARGAGGRRVRSSAYSDWLVSAGWEVKRQIIGMKPLECRFDLVLHVPISRRDTGNWEKAIGDLCEGVGVVTNDGNVHRIEIIPMDREDCMAAFYALPDMGGVRKPSRKRMPTARKAKNKPGLTWKL